MSGATDILRHGTADERLPSAPRIGQRYEAGGVAIDLNPCKPYEVNFSAPDDVLSLTLGRITGEAAYDTDRMSSFQVGVGLVHFHPAGSTSHVLGRQVEGEFLSFCTPVQLRERMAAELGVQGHGIERVAESLKTPNASAIASAARRFMLAGHAGGRMVAESISVLLLADSLEAIINKPGRLSDTPNGLDDARLARVMDRIEDALGTDISLNGLSSEVGLTPHHFARSFKAATGTSPHQYILERRISRAREKLDAGAESLADIAYDVGFSSQAHMTDVFKKRLGITPGKYRRERLS